jgi:LysR family transcriptional regulator, cyn operon transcriptional activator
MDLRQLEYAVAVADHGGFTSAARALHLSQPSLSHGVRQLEAELGVELFQRLGRTVRPSAAGERVVDAARRVLRETADGIVHRRGALSSAARAMIELARREARARPEAGGGG